MDANELRAKAREYRQKAANTRAAAEKTTDAKARVALKVLADQYDRTADDLDAEAQLG